MPIITLVITKVLNIIPIITLVIARVFTEAGLPAIVAVYQTIV
jgi:hypothetical protein